MTHRITDRVTGLFIAGMVLTLGLALIRPCDGNSPQYGALGTFRTDNLVISTSSINNGTTYGSGSATFHSTLEGVGSAQFDGTLYGSGAATFATTVAVGPAAVPMTLTMSGNSGLTMIRYGGTPGELIQRANGTSSSPTALNANDTIGGIRLKGYGSTAFSGGVESIGWLTSQAWTDSAQGSWIRFDTTPNGTTASTARMKIDQTGYVEIGSPISTTAVPNWFHLKNQVTATPWTTDQQLSKFEYGDNFNTTGGALESVAHDITNSSSRSSGGNNLTNTTLRLSATSGQVNNALKVLAGDIVLGPANWYVSGNNISSIGGCGTGATFAGDSKIGHVVVGTGSTDPCHIDWTQNLTVAPTCAITAHNGLPVAYDTFVNGLHLALGAAYDGTTVDWICGGTIP